MEATEAFPQGKMGFDLGFFFFKKSIPPCWWKKRLGGTGKQDWHKWGDQMESHCSPGVRGQWPGPK